MKQRIVTARQAGEILTQRRKARRLSQQEAASKLGLSQARLSALEANPQRWTLDRLIAIANLLGLELIVQDATKPRPTSEW
jgi:HTH-type transcriptional regulator / antitoxin HipB